ncbi:hypothetical protein [Frankia sp. CeD]|uniref:hypothetical protein n=1 Tax=Frankia sp. CeD TaxID=258230 RepID=UPI0004DD5832|nr:hypothetical protein [Frankia sp. CeD]KEZ37069.1 hypothetical protein CEDDRAFT_01596 [Frankia sp. CeD]
MREFRVGLACGHDLWFDQVSWAPIAGEVVWCIRCQAERETMNGRTPMPQERGKAPRAADARPGAPRATTRERCDGLSASPSGAVASRLDDARDVATHATKYPWGRWTDGRVRIIRRGRNFDVAAANMRTNLYAHAKRTGMTVRTSLDGDAILFQFFAEGASPSRAFSRPIPPITASPPVPSSEGPAHPGGVG